MELYALPMSSSTTLRTLLASVSAGEPLSMTSELEHIDANQLLLSFDAGAYGSITGRNLALDGLILHALEYLRRLPDTRGYSFSELFRANLFFADSLFEDVVRVNAVFNSSQPGIVDTPGSLSLTDVDQHHHRSQ